MTLYEGSRVARRTHNSKELPTIHSIMGKQQIRPVDPGDVLSTMETKLIKVTIINIVHPLTYIINKSFESGIVPKDMKIAKVIPIFKNND